MGVLATYLGLDVLLVSWATGGGEHGVVEVTGFPVAGWWGLCAADALCQENVGYIDLHLLLH